ncbi:MAG: hypothetical protein M1465_00550 [Candidatus Marsarchaeota archaeon]|nr:hypothetical protein [Candidatus Marsarchaeota archaeon]
MANSARSDEKAQMSLDFLISYGVAFIIIAAAVYIIMSSGIFNPTIVPSNCVPSPSFVCDSYGINSTGAMIIKLSQATGGTINVTGVACAVNSNATDENLPETGNINILGYSGDPGSYPSNTFTSNGVLIYSDGYGVLNAYCYDTNGGIDAQPLGNSFTGYIFINYTTTGLPSQHTLIKVASVTMKYT